MTSLNEERLVHARQIIKHINLPAQPKVVMEVDQEMHEADPDFQKIANLVSSDTSMAARVIKVINTPFFGLSRKVESITQALALMGLDNFYKVILTTCLQEKIYGDNAKYVLFWNHSLRTALTAEQIAKSLRSYLQSFDITSDLSYMAGLFHDAAIPVLLNKMPLYKDFSAHAMSHQLDIIAEEDRVVGSDHCVIGALLARTWSIPATVVKTIMHHHCSHESAERDAPFKLIALIRLADYLAYSFDYDTGAADLVIEDQWELEDWGTKNGEVLDELNLSLGEVAELKEETFEILAYTQ